MATEKKTSKAKKKRVKKAKTGRKSTPAKRKATKKKKAVKKKPAKKGKKTAKKKKVTKQKAPKKKSSPKKKSKVKKKKAKQVTPTKKPARRSRSITLTTGPFALDSRVRRQKDVAWRMIDGEAVIITPADSTMHTLNDVGTRIWELMTGERSLREVAQVLCAEFDVDKDRAEKDTIWFVECLAKKSLVENP